MLENVTVFHSSIRIVGSKTIYFDPYKIEESYNDADIIFITHEHFDHYSPEDIDKVVKEDTLIIVPNSMLANVDYNNVRGVNPEEEINIDGIMAKAIRSYNIGKRFHLKENDWLGYIVTMDEINYYVAGDTDVTEEAKSVKCDVAFLPCGGTYTMDYKEASGLANYIKPKIAVPTHYGSVSGSKEDGKRFIDLLDKEIEGIILIK